MANFLEVLHLAVTVSLSEEESIITSTSAAYQSFGATRTHSIAAVTTNNNISPESYNMKNS
jgi:hypothetical protein